MVYGVLIALQLSYTTMSSTTDLMKYGKEGNFEKVKEIIKRMNGMSEEEVINKYLHDINFHKGFDVLVELFIQAKFKV